MYENTMYIEALEENGAVVIITNIFSTSGVSFQYAINDTTNWYDLVFGREYALEQGNKMYIKGINSSLASNNSYSPFSISGGYVRLGGNIMGLLDGGACDTYTIESEECFKGLFYNCDKIRYVDRYLLPATTLSKGCYKRLFKGCSSLTSYPPVLPATTLVHGCYDNMYANCTNLFVAPELFATVLVDKCYYQMFSGCTSLNRVKMVASDISASQCLYEWLSNVSSTGTFYKNTSMPESTIGRGVSGIPTKWTVEDTTIGNTMYIQALEDSGATVMVSFTSGVYDSDVSLQYAKNNTINWTDISTRGVSITLEKGDRLYFKGSNSTLNTVRTTTKFYISGGNVHLGGNIMGLLDDGACTTTILSTSNGSCFAYLFAYCEKIVSVDNGFLGATQLGYLPYPDLIGAKYCYSYMFKGCTGLTQAPALPATILATNCYLGMFSGCSSLTESPVLPASTLVEGCYKNMFYNCTSLTEIAMLATNIGTYDLTNWVSGVASDGTFYKNNNTSIETIGRGVSGIPEGWTIVNYYERTCELILRGSNCELAGEGSFVPGTVVSIFCRPNEGYEFVSWSNGDTDASTTVTIPDNTTFTLIATVKQSTVQYTVELEGNDCTLTGAGTYDAGTEVTIKCTPRSGYVFIQWSDGNTDAERTIVVNSDIYLEAACDTAPTEYVTVTCATNPHCNVIGTGSKPVGSDFTITAVPDTDYVFQYWTINGNRNIMNPLYLLDVNEDMTISVTVQYRPHYTVSLSGSNCTFTGSGSYTAGSNVTIKCIPNQLYQFQKWIINGAEITSNPFTIQNIQSDVTAVAYVTQIQPMTNTIPIWRDNYYTSTLDSLSFSIEEENDGTIYSGKAYKMPNSSTISINISKIVEDYLSNKIADGSLILNPTDGVVLDNAESVKLFTLKDGNGSTLATYRYRYDWSYSGENYVSLTKPINGHYDNRMKLLSTSIVSNSTFKTTINSSLYTVPSCGDYALYYLQRNGGYASFLIEGNVKKTDNFNRYSYNMALNNTKPVFEECIYHNQITRDWELRTGWLKDTEAENLCFNLLSSNVVFLHNLNTDTIIPVVISNTNAEFKTFKNNSRKMVNYTITVKESQSKQML